MCLWRPAEEGWGGAGARKEAVMGVAAGQAGSLGESRAATGALDVLEGVCVAAGATVRMTPSGEAARRRIMAIGSQAQLLQQAACKTCAALETITAMQEALSFALDAAREALTTRSLPTAALLNLQKQVDLAVNALDWQADCAAFGDCRLFDGDTRIEYKSQRVDLPRLSSVGIGGGWVRSVAFDHLDTGGGEYSQCVASVLDGGPNCLAQWAGGAARALGAGLEFLEKLKSRLDGFYAGTVQPAVGELAVALSNAVATEFEPQGLQEAMAMLAVVKRDLESKPLTGTTDSQGVLELLT